MDRYALDNDAEQAPGRFGVLERCYDVQTRRCLSRIGIGPGQRCLEVGAGAGSVAVWMADQVGPKGAVLATDIKPHLSYADSPNLTVARHDVMIDPLPEAAYDLVHARLVLLHLPGRLEALRRLIAALKPGGSLLLEEFDCSWTPVVRASDPADAVLFEQVHTAFLRCLTAAGAEPLWGRKVFGAMADAGLVGLTSETYAETWTGGGPGIGLHRFNTEQLAIDLAAEGVSEGDLSRFWAVLKDPGFAVNSYPLVSVWARRPDQKG